MHFIFILARIQIIAHKYVTSKSNFDYRKCKHAIKLVILHIMFNCLYAVDSIYVSVYAKKIQMIPFVSHYYSSFS